jgi:hypothetical protein
MLRSGFILPPELKKDYRSGRLNAAELFSAQEIPINENGKPALLIRQNDANSICSGHNCPMWLYNQNGRFNLLLKTDIGYYDLVVLKQTSHGYNDLVVIRHSSAVEHELINYKFNGRGYQAAKCLTETGEEDAQGKINYQYQEHKCD